jgi:hypothetical protein
MCLKSNHLSNLDHKVVEEASDGLQKVQVAIKFLELHCWFPSCYILVLSFQITDNYFASFLDGN